MSARRLLWMEDEPYRVEYEAGCITEQGWDVHLAETAIEAAQKLARTPFHALILDQMFDYPVDGRRERIVWAGCFLLRWLRGKDPPGAAPRNLVEERYLWHEFEPLVANIGIPAIVVSGFHNQRVEDAIRATSPQDSGIRTFAKPIQDDQLLGFLDTITMPDEGAGP